MSFKEGIVEYRPKKIKAEIFPYEDGKCNIEKLLDHLAKFKLITFYEHKETSERIIFINKFLDHQNPHRNEKSCGITNLEDYQEITGNFNKLHPPLLNDVCCLMNDERGKSNKKKFGELQNVFLKKEEFEKLKTKFGEKPRDEKINALSFYIKSKGDKYKDHYATILSWSLKDKPTISIKNEIINVCGACIEYPGCSIHENNINKKACENYGYSANQAIENGLKESEWI